MIIPALTFFRDGMKKVVKLNEPRFYISIAAFMLNQLVEFFGVFYQLLQLFLNGIFVVPGRGIGSFPGNSFIHHLPAPGADRVEVPFLYRVKGLGHNLVKSFHFGPGSFFLRRSGSTADKKQGQYKKYRFHVVVFCPAKLAPCNWQHLTKII